MKFNLRQLLFFVTIVAFIILLFRLTGISKRDHTLAAIVVIKRAVHCYAKENSKLPATVEDLDEFVAPRYLVDGWGKTMILKFDGETLTIGSFGQDGVKGGMGEKSDILCRFACFDENGNFYVAASHWLTDSELYDLQAPFHYTRR